MFIPSFLFFFFFFNDTPTTEIYTLSLHDALPIPDPVDLAIITVPAEIALAAVEECGRKGVPGLVVITAGFREVGGAGIEREERLLALCRQYQMTMIGPNCM